MKITIRYTEDCPNAAKAEQRVGEALRLTGIRANVRLEIVPTIADAERLRFSGSPTILIDGMDPFVRPDASPAVACRLYETEAGSDGAPSVSQLREALRR